MRIFMIECHAFVLFATKWDLLETVNKLMGKIKLKKSDFVSACAYA